MASTSCCLRPVVLQAAAVHSLKRHRVAHSGHIAKVQTHSTKTAHNRRSSPNGSALWRNPSTRAAHAHGSGHNAGMLEPHQPELARKPLDMHVGGTAHVHIIRPTCAGEGLFIRRQRTSETLEHNKCACNLITQSFKVLHKRCNSAMRSRSDRASWELHATLRPPNEFLPPHWKPSLANTASGAP